MQQMSKRGTDPGHVPLAGTWTFARRQMLSDETAYQQFVNGVKRKLLLRQPVRKMPDAIQIRPNSRSAIPLAL